MGISTYKLQLEKTYMLGRYIKYVSEIPYMMKQIA